MRAALKLPGVSPAVSQLVTHVLIVFVVAFGAQVSAADEGAIHDWPTLLALITAAAAAGATAVIHYIMGLVPAPAAGVRGALIPAKVTNPFVQVAWSAVVVFLTSFGSQLAVGASGVVSAPTLEVLVVSAVSAAVTALLQWVLHLVPVPPAAMVPYAPAVPVTVAAAPPAPAKAAKVTKPKAPAKKTAK